MLLKNCFHVASHEGPALTEVDIKIEKNRITAIGKNLSGTLNADELVLDCSSCVVIPGLVNTHHHFYQTLTRNLPRFRTPSSSTGFRIFTISGKRLMRKPSITPH